jgi:hypothetical protein
VQLGGERGAHDEQAAHVGDLLEAPRLPGEAPVDAVEAGLGAGVDEHAGEHVGEAVAGRAVHRPVLGQLLVVGEDLLHHDPAPGEDAGEALEVLARVGKPVRMVDAHAVDAAAPGKAPREGVRRVEHHLVLDAHPGEVGDLEEAPVVDLVGSDAPVGQAIVLPLEQPVQRERVLYFLQISRALFVQRKPVIEVTDARALELQLARLERLAVVLAQHRQQELPRPPVDVEELRVGRRPALLQHVEPPGVVRMQHAHVVGHEVHNEAHALRF